MKRLPIFLIILAALFLMQFAAPDGSGFSIDGSENEYKFVAVSSSISIISGIVIALVTFFIPRKEIIVDVTTPVGIFRRLGAIYINMFAIMIPTIPLLVLSLLAIEAIHIGEFHWSVYREFPRSTDALVGSSIVFFIFGLIYYYYFKALKTGKPTIGQYLMGYGILGNNEDWTTKRALVRIGLSTLTLCIWPISIFFALRHPKKAFWFDTQTNSIATRFRYDPIA